MTIAKQDFIKLLVNYDFINNSIRSFSKKYNVHYNTVSKYLRENNICYNRKETNLERIRDVNGKFILSVNEITKENAIVLSQHPLRGIEDSALRAPAMRNIPIKCRSFKDLQKLKL
jgi:hypothetical protein